VTKVIWDKPNERIFEAGIDRGVLYPPTGFGVPWNGLKGVDEKSTGGEISAFYMDGIKYIQIGSPEDFFATLKAYMYPEEFEQCDGTFVNEDGLMYGQQPRRQFGLTYRTLVGDGVEGIDRGYKIHIIYNALATPTQHSYLTLGAETDPTEFSWDLSTIPISIPGARQTAHLTIDSRKVNPSRLALVESYLYGTPFREPTLPSPEQIAIIINPRILDIIPNYITGLSALTYPGLNDLIGDVNKGIYLTGPDTRLTFTSVEGIYSLEA